MKRLQVGELSEHLGQRVRVAGFVDTIRNLKNVQFIVLRDRTGCVQIVHHKSENESLANEINNLTPESALWVEGELEENSDVELNGFEIILDEIEVSSKAEPELPVGPESDMSRQIDWRSLSLRYPKNTLVFEVQTALERGMREFWEENGFIEIHSPKLMSTASESGSELFTLEYFDKSATLAQSPQFYKQMAMAAGFERVFEIGPVFRANPSFTSRHDTEFTSVDMEVSWIDSHEDVMRVEERWLASALSRVKEEFGSEIRDQFGVEVTVPEVPFPRVTLSEALDIAENRGHSIEHREDLDPQGEREVSRYIQEELDHEFVFVTDYPSDVRPFYHMRQSQNPKITKSFDLLWKGLEVTTGAQREHRVEVLESQAIEKGVDLESISSYLDFFRYGVPPHGGVGVGLTRLLMILLDRDNVREVTYIYRGPDRLTP